MATKNYISQSNPILQYAVNTALSTGTWAGLVSAAEKLGRRNFRTFRHFGNAKRWRLSAEMTLAISVGTVEDPPLPFAFGFGIMYCPCRT